MAGMSLDGLVSGMSTSDLISQLMKVESAPKTALQNKVTVQNKAVGAYQSVNSKFASLLTAAKALGDPNTWTAMKATSSSAAAAVVATPGAAAGSLSFKVNSLAAAHNVTFTGRVTSLTDATAAPVMSGSTFDVLKSDGTSVTVTPTDKSLQSVVKAINDTAGAAYKAAAVQVAPGQYTLQLTATATGAASTFAAAFTDPAVADVPAGIDLLGGPQIITQGTDAQLTVGTTSTFTMTSASNTFTDVLPGVTVTAAKVQAADESPVTITVSSDVDGIANKVKSAVDAANAAIGEMRALSIPKNGAIPAGALSGDALIRQLTQDILGTVSGGAGSLGSYADAGVKLDKSGSLVFTKETFVAKFTADPALAQQFFDSYTNNTTDPAAQDAFEPGWDTAIGLGRKLEELATRASQGIILPTDPVDKVREGLLPGMISRRNSYVTDLNTQISNWDIRLATREAALKKQFTGLETALGKMKQQSSWLAGQLATLG
jgi:flagellar hook-associated protein 2